MNIALQGVRLVVIATLLVGMSNGQPAKSQPPQTETNVDCVEWLQVPPYPVLATQARIQGTITAAVMLTTGGKVAKVETDATSTYPKANNLLGERRVSTTLRQSVKEFTEYRRLMLLAC